METLETTLKPESALADRDITAAVERLFARKKGVATHLVDVSTRQGIVTLCGYVDNLLARERAEEIAKAVRGVRGVINEIGVRAIDLPDATLRRDVEEALLQDAVTSEYEICCTAREGTVMLLGEVPSWPEKELVLRVAKGVRGVCAVDDHLRYRLVDQRPPKSAAEISAELDELLGWDVRINHALIEVRADGQGRVVLGGTVASAAERSHAITAAWRAGASSVDAAELRVAPDAHGHELRGDKYRARTDAEIRQAIEDSLLTDPRVRANAAEIEVEQGQVTLRGSVSNLRACRAAEQDALGIVGVAAVSNYLRVRPVRPTADAEIQRRTRAALLRDAYLHRGAVEVVVGNGKVSLYGTVDSQFEKQHAEQVAAGISGVIAVDNRLVVPAWATTPDGEYFACNVAYSQPLPGQPPTDEAIEQAIRQQLDWTPGLSQQDIRVGVAKGRATLTGTVDTRQEQQLATLCAYDGGAHAVANQLHVRHGAAR
ncbi:BON domain-containing protein [Hymenobacter jeollabukensis]|uniref:BON domain-containing protein n=1 Tax=Hymenobacter jeollabukensis TaxID=2025313 RepID=A0A5R8WWF2_9BACT|nr:BON domain-containing protein [Hymenobacter jeollabukensis]TLM96475.1 BON domain-containing protein [Hymenobacter jeollabukensis]